MKNMLIDGFALGDVARITGVQRSMRELVLEMDKQAGEYPYKVYYLYSTSQKNTLVDPNGLTNIVPVGVTRKCPLIGFKLRAFFVCTKKLNGIIFNMSTTGRYFLQRNQMSFVYDLRPVLFDYDVESFRKCYTCFLKFAKKHSKIIFNDSDYQKKDILKFFRLKDESKVQTVYMGYEHMVDVRPDSSIFEQYPALKEKGYYYALGSLAPHKNFEWVVEQVRRHPSLIFAICGAKDPGIWNEDYDCSGLDNLIFLGRLSDGQSKAMMMNCRGFLMPSRYEGFGIPPLEALYCGATVFCSNASCLPEIFEDSVHYFDPDDYGYDLEAHLKEPLAGGVPRFWENAVGKNRRSAFWTFSPRPTEIEAH